MKDIGWMMKDEWWKTNDERCMMKDESWRMKDENIDFKLFEGFGLWQTNEQTDKQTDICDCRVAFATENCRKSDNCIIYLTHQLPTERVKNKRMKMGKF